LKKYEAQDNVKSGNTVLYFTAPWCGPCKVFRPTVEAVSSERTDYVGYVVDIEANDGIMSEYGVKAVPALISMVDGVEVARRVGALSPSLLNDYLDSSFKQEV
jgi:thioredoxin 1